MVSTLEILMRLLNDKSIVVILGIGIWEILNLYWVIALTVRSTISNVKLRELT